MIKMNRYLYDILDEFKEYVNSGVTLCDLKKVNFLAGNLPDYSDIHVQQLYLLRYAYGYGFEYKQMYRALWEKMNHPSRLKVTSVGCGTMIDYWSLTQVVPESCKVEYTGIDVIDWSYRMKSRPQDNVLFLQTDAVSFFEEDEAPVSDVYIFPKSISEFSTEELQKICRALCEKCPKDKTVYFLFSLRSIETYSRDLDMEKTKQLYDELVGNGFRSCNAYTAPDHLPEELQEKYIDKVDPTFFCPNKAVDYLKELHTCCPEYIKNGKHCESDCETQLKWWPILKCKYALWQLFEFRKEGSR